MATLVLTTVGTTALTNGYVDRQSPAVKRWAGAEEALFQRDAAHEDCLVQALVRNYDIAARQMVSAEIASLSLIVAKYDIKLGDGSRFVFICSHTNRGMACAQVNARAFREIFKPCGCEHPMNGECGPDGDHVRIERLPGVQHRKVKEFQSSIEGLAEVVRREKDRFTETFPGTKRVFNITGAYKGLIPWRPRPQQRGFRDRVPV